MDREFRFKPVGFVFIISIIVPIIISNQKFSFPKNSLQVPIIAGIDPVLISIIGVVTGLLTIDAIGILINSIVLLVFNLTGGYSKWFMSHIDLKESINGKYEYICKMSSDKNILESIFTKWQSNSKELFFLFFYWYRDGHPFPEDDWLIRRFTAFFMNINCIVAIFLGLFLGFIAIGKVSIYLSGVSIFIISIYALLIIAFILNAKYTRKEARQIITFWFEQANNPKFRYLMDTIHPIPDKSTNTKN